MNKEDIIRMAREAGAAVGKPTPDAPEIIFSQCMDVERFAALVASAAVRETSAEYRLGWNDGQIAEREACAKVCETLWNTSTNGMATEEQSYGDECALAIRARGQA